MKDLIEKHSVQAIFAAITSAIGGIWAREKARRKAQAERQTLLEERQKLLEDGMQALLCSSITDDYYGCHERGYCPMYTLDSVESMYIPYHALGGNGGVTVMINEMRNMPHVKPGEVGE